MFPVHFESSKCMYFLLRTQYTYVHAHPITLSRRGCKRDS